MSLHVAVPPVHSAGSIWNRPGCADSVSNRRSNAFVLPVHVGSSITRPLIDISVLRTSAHVISAVADSVVSSACAVACAVGSTGITNGARHAGLTSGPSGIAASTGWGLDASGAAGCVLLSPHAPTRSRTRQYFVMAVPRRCLKFVEEPTMWRCQVARRVCGYQATPRVERGFPGSC
jgi:hypothetical protein